MRSTISSGGPIASPSSFAEHFSEALYELPCIAPFEPPADAPLVSTLPADTNEFVTFGSFNRLQKLSPSAPETWARILEALPTSRLIIKAAGVDTVSVQQGVLQPFRSRGIAEHRIELSGGTGRATHLDAYRRVDLALDPFPHGGGVTALEGLWMGVPLMTLLGNRVQGRLGASFLTFVDLAYFIAPSEDQYVERAVAMAHRTDRLVALRRELRSRVGSSILCQHDRYTRAVEDAYVDIWRRWCEHAPDQTFDRATRPPSR